MTRRPSSAFRRGSRRSSILVGFVLVASGVSATSVAAQANDRAVEPAERLEELVRESGERVGLSGDEAIRALDSADIVDEVAENAELEPAELVEHLAEDPTMFVTADGMVGYAEPAPLAAELTGEPDALTVAPGEASTVDVFSLQSRPSSRKVIYLDFDGHTTVGDYWNDQLRSPSLVSAPYATPATVTSAQRDVIYEIWQRVAEDYLPFDVNVTTRDPGVEGLRRTSAADTAYGQRMVISPTNWVGSGTLGIAMLSVFDESFDHSAFVFTRGRSARVIAEAVSHEAGHTLGLRHDGDSNIGSEYYDGHGQWAPIMGRSIDLATPVTQWSRGEYAGATNGEDDIAGIASYVGYRTDDHADIALFATLVGSASTTDGVVGAGGDVDVFAVDVGAGAVEVSLGPTFASLSNLLASITVRDSAGAVVGTGSPQSATDWTATAGFVAPAPGRYTIEVRPVGWLNPVDTGFSTYGSMGAYQLQVSGATPPPSTPPPPPGLPPTSKFTPLTPSRLLDTRSGLGGSTGLRAGEQVVLQVAGRGGVPIGATAAVLGFVAVDPSAPGYLTTFPCSSPRPLASTVNFVPNQTVANTMISALSPSGQVCIWASADTDVIVDATGWLGPYGQSAFTPAGPNRVMDPREGLGAMRPRADGTVSLDFSRTAPAGTTAVALNVTSTGAAGPGFVTVYPCSTGRPSTSTLNHLGGEARPNNTIVGLGGGRVCIYAQSSTDIVVDVLGYFGPTGLTYLATSPIRLIDTRQTVRYLPADTTVAYRASAPSLGDFKAEAAFVNVTAVDHAVPGFVTTFDCVTRRVTSTVNPIVGEANANGATVPLRNGVDSCAYTRFGGNLVVDLNGWWVR
jgi:hypothetical protein